ncbi:hypothetical protein ACP2W8_13090 [Bacillus subtilis]
MSKEINTKELDEELKRVLKMFDDVLEVYEQRVNPLILDTYYS